MRSVVSFHPLSLCLLAFTFLSQTSFAETRILVVGDSLTAGYGVNQTSAFPKQLENLLKKKNHKVQVIAAGSSGATSAGATNRLRWHLKRKPDILILALGANDGLRGLPVESTQKNLAAAIDLAKENKIKVLLAGMKMPTNYGEDYQKKYEKVFSDLSQEKQITLIPFLLKDVAVEKEYNLADGIHPNEKGHLLIAENLLKYVEPIL